MAEWHIYFRIWIYKDNKNWYLLCINFFFFYMDHATWNEQPFSLLYFSTSWQSSSSISSLSNWFPNLQFLATPLGSPCVRPSPQKDHRTSTRRWYCYGLEYVTNRLRGHRGGHHHSYYCGFVSPSVDRVFQRVLSNISTSKIHFLWCFQLWIITGAGEMVRCAKCLWCKHNAVSFILRTHVKSLYGTVLLSPALGRQKKSKSLGFAGLAFINIKFQFQWETLSYQNEVERHWEWHPRPLWLLYHTCTCFLHNNACKNAHACTHTHFIVWENFGVRCINFYLFICWKFMCFGLPLLNKSKHILRKMLH